jgi:signal peptidase I
VRPALRRLRAFAFGAAACLAASFALRIWVADVFAVRTPSMEPSIDGARGEWLLVRFGRAGIERFDLAVFTQPGDRAPIVKRVVALPGETVQIVGGDLLVDGERLAPSARWPVEVPVFDDRVQSVEDHFHLGSARAWQRVGDAWELDAFDVVAGSRAGTLGYHKLVGTGYLRPSGESVHGDVQVNDVFLTAVVEHFEGAGHVLFEVLEEGDQFQVRITRGADGLVFELHRLPAEVGAPDTLLARAGTDIAGDRPFEVRLGNADNCVRVLVDGRLVLDHTYPANRPYRGMTQTPEEAARGTGTVRKSIAPQAVLGGVGVRARFARIRVGRDLYYATSALLGEYADRARLALGPGEYFVLGDNTLDSVDGRRFGPLESERIVGRATAVVWPLGRVRGLP